MLVHLAAFDYKLFLVIRAVSACEGCFIVGVEEVFLAECFDFAVNPIKQRFVAL